LNPAGWNFACPDWEAKLKRGETPIPELPLDQIEADVAVELYNRLRLPDVPGQPTMGEAAGEHVRDIIRAAFGSVDVETGQRMVGELFELIPKKNSKTTDSAALGLVALQMNRRPNIDGVIIGPTQEVAAKCFTQMVGMIEADPYLINRFRIVEHKQMIIDLYRDPETGIVRNAKLKVKSFDLKVVTGSIPAFAIIDELHVMAQSHNASRIIAQIRGGMITNPESLLIFITTQSDTPPSGVFKEELDYARSVRDGRITNDVRMLPVLYEFPEDVQVSKDKKWRDTKLWPMVLPNLGRSVHLARLASEYRIACDKGMESEIIWASQHLNIQIGMGLHTDRWVGADLWEAAEDANLSLEEIMAQSEVCVVGIDGGGMDDLFGLHVLGRHRETREMLAWSRAWIHKVVLERRKSIAPLLEDFAKDGDLVICKDKTQDIREVTEICLQLSKAGLLPENSAIGIDNSGPHGSVSNVILEAGITSDQLQGVQQGYKLNGAIKDVERKLFDGSFRHAAQPLMNWCVSNAKTETKGNAVVITKAVSGTGKIDPLMALFNAMMLMSLNPEAHRADSIYRTRGLLAA
jgi:phage terminase large subunit-like protein